MCEYCEGNTEVVGGWAAGGRTYIAAFIEGNHIVMREFFDYDEMANGGAGDQKDAIEISACPICSRKLG